MSVLKSSLSAKAMVTSQTRYLHVTELLKEHHATATTASPLLRSSSYKPRKTSASNLDDERPPPSKPHSDIYNGCFLLGTPKFTFPTLDVDITRSIHQNT